MIRRAIHEKFHANVALVTAVTAYGGVAGLPETDTDNIGAASRTVTKRLSEERRLPSEAVRRRT